MSKGTGAITQEHNGNVYEIPIVVLAENVKTDSTHQFVTQEEKESITQTIEKVGKYPAFGEAAKCGVANNDTTTTEGYLADARIVKTHGEEIDNISQEVSGVKRAFTDGCNTLVSACTTYGATPESNSPAHISEAIAKIYNNRYASGYNQGLEDATLEIYKSIDMKSENNINNMKTITVDCTDLAGYGQYTKEDFIVVPTSVYEKNEGFEDAHALGKIDWNYNNGILTIINSVLGQGNEADGQLLLMWYSSFDIYAK